MAILPEHLSIIAEAYDEIAATYDRSRLGWYRSIIRLIASKVESPLLDIGCGTGYIACKLAIENRSDIACIDASRRMVRITWRRAKRWRVDAYIHPVQAALPLLPLRDKTFRSALALAVIHHLHGKTTRIAALREIRRVSRTLVLTVWRLATPENLVKALRVFSRDVTIQWGGRVARYYHLYTRRGLEEELRRAGYSEYKIYSWDYKRRIFKRNLVVESESTTNG